MKRAQMIYCSGRLVFVLPDDLLRHGMPNVANNNKQNPNSTSTGIVFQRLKMPQYPKLKAIPEKRNTIFIASL
jgi:hypothetical protein